MIKQRTRASAYALVQAEAALANQQWAAKQPQVVSAELIRAWEHVTFNQFHDAITGTHIDAGYDELMDMLDQADGIAATHGGDAGARCRASVATHRRCDT